MNKYQLTRKRVYDTHGGRCFYCDAPTSLSGDTAPRGLRIGTLDHIIPRGRGGKDRPRNYVWACQHCNRKRGCRDFIEFAIPFILQRDKFEKAAKRAMTYSRPVLTQSSVIAGVTNDAASEPLLTVNEPPIAKPALAGCEGALRR